LAAPEPTASSGADTSRPPAEPIAFVLVLDGPIDRADAPPLCEQIAAALAWRRVAWIVCDVGAVTCPDAGTVDALARMALTARRLGSRVVLRQACCELKQLLTLVGLADVLACEELLIEARRQAEEREPLRRVEEEDDPVDPIT